MIAILVMFKWVAVLPLEPVPNLLGAILFCTKNKIQKNSDKDLAL
jgi:hypothetical protein